MKARDIGQFIADQNKIAYLVLNFLDQRDSEEFIPEPDAIPPF